MYNDPIAIKMLAERVMAEIDWTEMQERRISEATILNLVRAMLRPLDKFNEASQRRVVNEVVAALRRIYPVR